MTFPSWWALPGQPPVRYMDEASVPKGAELVPGDYNVQTGQWEYPPEEPDIKELRAEYKAKFGKRPFNGWSEAELRGKLA